MPESEALITMETDSGAPAPLPKELQPTPPAAPPAVVAAPETPPEAPAPTPEVAAPAAPVEPPEPQADENDPRVAGILRDLRQTREQVKQWQGMAQAGMTLAQRLQSRPDLLAQLNGQPAAPAPEPQKAPAGPPEHELRELAETLALVTPEGRPDIAAAGRVYAMNVRTSTAAAEQAVNRAIQPMQAQITRDKAEGRRVEALKVAKDLGVDDQLAQTVIDGIMQTNPEILAVPEQAATALLVAVGLNEVQKRHGRLPSGAPAAPAPAPAAPPAPGQSPVFTEGTSSRAPVPSMSTLEIQMAKRAGVKPADWQKATGVLSNAKETDRFFVMEDD